MQLLTGETSDFTAPTLWPANSPDLNTVDYQTWGSIAAGCMTLTPEVTSNRRVRTFPPGIHRWSDQAVASASSNLHSSTWRTFWTQTSYVWYLYRRRPTLWQSYVCVVAYSGDFCFGGDLTKPSITIASVDRFYLNLVICLQLDIALLVQNSVKILHCLSELWQCIQGVTFFVDTV